MRDSDIFRYAETTPLARMDLRGKADAPHEVLETRILAQAVPTRLGFKRNHEPGALLVRFFERSH